MYAEGIVVPRTDAEARRVALLAEGLADGRLEVVPEVQLVG